MNINFKKILNWDIHSVSAPVPVFEVADFSDGKKKLSGYSVTVNYVHHGMRYVFFDADSERSWIMFGGPKEEAEDFYRHMLMKQKKQELKRGKIITRQR